MPYLQFLAPALLVSTVMQGSTFEATFPVLGGFRWVRRYHAMYATPLAPYAIAFGQIAWIATRATLVASIFCARDPRCSTPRRRWASCSRSRSGR